MLDRIATRLGVGARVGLGWPLFFAALAAAASVGLLAISGWFLTGAAIAGAAGGTAVGAFNYLLPSAAIRALAILRTASRYAERLSSHAAALTAMAGLRTRLFGRLAQSDPRESPNLASGEASSRLIDDISAIEDLIVRRSAVPGALIGGVVATACIALSGWRAALAFIALSAIGLAGGTLLARQISAGPARMAAQARGRLRDHYVELAAARPEIIAYGLADRIDAALHDAHADRDTAQRNLVRGEAMLTALVAIWSVGVAVVTLMLAGNGAALAALSTLAAFAGSDALAAQVRSALRDAVVREGLARIDALADLPTAEPAVHGAPEKPVRIGDLWLQPGDRLLLGGVSGSGKTTLVETLAGLREAPIPLTLGAKPVVGCSATELAGQFALAPQSPQLIAGTIGDNLRLARPGLQADALWVVLDVVCLADRVRAMPDGLDTYIGEMGGTLSGGEQKRLSLARALLAARPWLIADEPTEGLDPATESALVNRLDAWLTAHGTGLILVSHRPAPRALCSHMLPLPLRPALF